MVNHLYRTKEARRHLQADLLNEWASQQQLPVIAVGDYNLVIFGFPFESIRGVKKRQKMMKHVLSYLKE